MSDNVTVVIRADSKQFMSDMREVNAELKMTESNGKLLQSEAKLTGNQTSVLQAKAEALKEKISALNESVELYQNRLAQLNENYQMLNEEMADNLSSQYELQSSYDSLSASIAELESQQESLIAERETAIDQWGEDSAVVAEYDDTLASLSATYEAQTAELAELQAELATTATEYDTLSAAMEKTNLNIAATTTKLNDTKSALNDAALGLRNANKAAVAQPFNRFSKAMGKVSKGAHKIAKSLMPLAAISGVVAGASLDAAVKFNDAMAMVKTNADLTKVSMSQLRQGVLQVSGTYGESATEVADALYKVDSMGIKTSNAIKFLNASSKLAIAGNAQLIPTVQTLGTVVNAYGMNMKQANQVANELIQTQQLGDTTFQALSTTLSTVVPTAAAVHVGFSQVCESLVDMSHISPDMAENTTYLRRLLDAFSKSGSKCNKVLQKLYGTGFAGCIKKGLTLGDILQKMKQYSKKTGVSMNNMFSDVRAGQGAMMLAHESAKEFNSGLKSIQGNTTALSSTFKTIVNSPGRKFKILLTQLKNAGIQLGDALLPVALSLAQHILKLVQAFNKLSPATKKVIADVLLGIVSFTLLMGAVSKVAGAFKLFGDGLGKIAGLFARNEEGTIRLVAGFKKVINVIKIGASAVVRFAKLFVSSMKLLLDLFVEFGQNCLKLAKVIGTKLVEGIKLFGSAMKLVGQALVEFGQNCLKLAKVILTQLMEGLKAVWAVLLENPILIVIAAIAAIGVALYEAYEHCTWFRNMVNEIWNDIKQYFENFVNWLNGPFTGNYSGAFGKLAFIVKYLYQQIGVIIHMIIGVFEGLINFVVGVFTGNWSEAWDGIKEIFGSIWNGILNLGTNLIQDLWAAITGKTESISQIWTSVWDSLPGPVQSAISWVISGVEGMVSTVLGLIHGLESGFQDLANGFSHVKNFIVSGAHAIGLAVIPDFSQFTKLKPPMFTQSFAAIPQNLAVTPTITESSAGLSPNIDGLDFSLDSTGIDLDVIVNKAVDKICKTIKLNSNKTMITKVELDSKTLVTQTQNTFNEKNGESVELAARCGGVILG
ncbi:phage tail tape measure protein [Clostridium thermobutyricum]|uniref:phage tail tape measure protein n=1 Tax=Clostridium thermobutyricum TaxID=29372 RepID=UPI0018AAEAEE|nr:phage tail tape measure protein [Clostridium thermobutyricum]